MNALPERSVAKTQAARFERFVAVLELGERFPHEKRREPLPDLTALWRAAASSAGVADRASD